MAAKSSDLDDQKSGINIQTDGHTLTPPSGWNGLEEAEAFGSSPSCSPSQSPVRKPKPDHPETQYCLEIKVISTKDGGMTPPHPHTWQVPVVEDMVWDGKSSLTEAEVTGPGQAILFYGWWSLGEGLGLGKVRDALLTLSGAISWVSKQALLSANLISLVEGWRLITQAITKRCTEPRRPGCPRSIPPASTPFNFSNQGQSPWLAGPSTPIEQWGMPKWDPRLLYQKQGQALQKDWGQGQQELWPAPHPLPSPSPDSGFESDQISVSTSSMTSAMSDGSGGSRHSHHGWWCCRGSRGHMKINLPVFKDEDTKDTVNY